MAVSDSSTIANLLHKSEDYFRRKGIETARLDAELLLAHALGLKRIDLYLNYDKPLMTGEVDSYRELVRRRGKREPVSYIIGRQDFYEISLQVTPAVLIPRQETEILTESAVKAAQQFERPVILEVGVGSGAICLSLAKALPQAFIVGTDICAEALAVARQNARELEVDHQVALVQSDVAEVFTSSNACFHLILSNPPYIRDRDFASLMPEIRDFEPRTALAGGSDGLAISRRIITAAESLLHDGGKLFMEIGFDQADAVCQEMETAGVWEEISVSLDYSRLPRVISGVRKQR